MIDNSDLNEALRAITAHKRNDTMLDKHRKLQASLKAGDIIISTDTAYFEYDEDVKAKKLYSQKPGDLLMVNNTHVNYANDGQITYMGDSVQGIGLNGESYTGRKRIGLGGSLRVGKFRLATPDDPGYMATRDVFELHDEKVIAELKQKLTFVYVMGSVFVAMSAWVLSTMVV